MILRYNILDLVIVNIDSKTLKNEQKNGNNALFL